MQVTEVLAKIRRTIKIIVPECVRLRLRAAEKKLKEWLLVRSVQQNYKRKIKKLSKSKDKVKVAFLVSENAKWNGDSLYKKLEADNRFTPVVLYRPLHANFYKDSNDDVNHQFFLARGYNFAVLANDADLWEHKPDVVFYQQPWDARDGDLTPASVSQYSLCLYFPYSIATTIELQPVWNACALFFKTLYRHFVYNAFIVEQFNAKGVYNTIASGHPKMDAYIALVKRNPWKDTTKFKIVYAPHHSFSINSLQWATFDWNGRKLLEWAKTHTDTEWIFKPHPRFRYAALETGIMNETEIDEYYGEWNRIGAVYDQGDYFDMFRTADLLITDCGSFLTEWLPTEKPCIHLLTDNDAQKSRSFVHENSSRHFYKVKNINELNATMEMLVIRREDPLVVSRRQDAKNVPLDSAKNIHQWLVETIWGKK